MRHVFCTFTLCFAIVYSALGQESKIYTPQKGDWGISIDASSLFNILNKNNSYEDFSISTKYLLSDKFSSTIQVAALGVYNKNYNVEHNNDISTYLGFYSASLGFQYLHNTEKRLRVFTGASITFTNTTGLLSEGDDRDKENLKISHIYTAPYYITFGAGVEIFLFPKISLSSDVSFIFTWNQETGELPDESGRKYRVSRSFAYMTCVGGLGGKLSFNIYL